VNERLRKLTALSLRQEEGAPDELLSVRLRLLECEEHGLVSRYRLLFAIDSLQSHNEPDNEQGKRSALSRKEGRKERNARLS
jgi:hypothetical protein